MARLWSDRVYSDLHIFTKIYLDGLILLHIEIIALKALFSLNIVDIPNFIMCCQILLSTAQREANHHMKRVDNALRTKSQRV